MEVKKSKKADLRNKRWMLLSVSLTISLGLTLTAFEWKSYDDTMLFTDNFSENDFEDIIEMPQTIQPPPPRPPKVLPQIVEVPNDEEVEVEDVIIDVDQLIDEPIPDVIFAEAPPEEVIEKIFDIVEDKPEFMGGTKAMYDYLGRNMNYPAQARRMGIEGRVFVRFVVSKDGSISDAEVIKGIGAGCDEEALRVIAGMPRWNPGKQRGVPVKARMVIPVYFRLSN